MVCQPRYRPSWTLVPRADCPTSSTPPRPLRHNTSRALGEIHSQTSSKLRPRGTSYVAVKFDANPANVQHTNAFRLYPGKLWTIEVEADVPLTQLSALISDETKPGWIEAHSIRPDQTESMIRVYTRSEPYVWACFEIKYAAVNASGTVHLVRDDWDTTLRRGDEVMIGKPWQPWTPWGGGEKKEVPTSQGPGTANAASSGWGWPFRSKGEGAPSKPPPPPENRVAAENDLSVPFLSTDDT